jgi:hypothetical protein
MEKRPSQRPHKAKITGSSPVPATIFTGETLNGHTVSDKQELNDSAVEINRKLADGREPAFLWVVYNDSRHVDNRFSYIVPHENIGDVLLEKDPWGRSVKVTKIVRYDLAEVKK